MDGAIGKMKGFFLASYLVFVLPIQVHAGCIASKAEMIDLKPTSCRVVAPATEPKLVEMMETIGKDSDKAWTADYQKKINDYYAGAVITDAARNQYFYRSKETSVCDKFKAGSSVTLIKKKACCDGDPNPPCWLGFGARLEDPK